MRMAVKVIAIATLGALIAGPAFAQNNDEFDLRKRVEELDKAAEQRREKAAETDRAYQRLLKSEPSDSRTQKVDPWGNIRTAAPGKASPQSAK